MAQNNGDFTAKECRAVMKYLFLKGNSAKNIYDDMSVTLGDKRPSYSMVKNCVVGFRTGHLSTEDEERPGETNSSDNSRKHGCHSFHDPEQSKDIC
jgi:hypothetical protein